MRGRKEGCVVAGVVFTAKGGSGLERVGRVLSSYSISVHSVGRTNVGISVIRSKGAFRSGTLVGTHTVTTRASTVILTSSSKLRVSCLGGRPKMCSTHCVNRSASCSVGGGGLVRHLSNIPGRGHATHFIYTVTTILPSKGRLIAERAVRNCVK